MIRKRDSAPWRHARQKDNSDRWHEFDSYLGTLEKERPDDASFATFICPTRL